ncbi:MAG: hypothetical protein P1U70_04845 [Saprospiraceae bacterium]|nr:hypothetical protein [Saprospiraceae bacterium]
MRIKKLKLYSNQINKLIHFYESVLGFEITKKKSTYFEVKIGYTILAFEESNQACYYHFAFNIPSFQSLNALKWLQKRVEILPDETGKLICEFVNWNAEAIYFYDPAGNVLEFIARKNLNIVANEKFSSKSVINISEMAMPVNDVKAHFDFLNNEFEDFSIEKYSGDYKRFCASGDEEGLFIIVDTKVKKWYPTNKPSLAFPFEIWFESNNKNYHLIEKETFTFVFF